MDFHFQWPFLIVRTHSVAQINYKTVLWGFLLSFLFISVLILLISFALPLLLVTLCAAKANISSIEIFLIFFMAKGHAIRPYFHYFHFSFPFLLIAHHRIVLSATFSVVFGFLFRDSVAFLHCAIPFRPKFNNEQITILNQWMCEARENSFLCARVCACG